MRQVDSCSGFTVAGRAILQLQVFAFGTLGWVVLHACRCQLQQVGALVYMFNAPFELGHCLLGSVLQDIWQDPNHNYWIYQENANGEMEILYLNKIPVIVPGEVAADAVLQPSVLAEGHGQGLSPQDPEAKGQRMRGPRLRTDKVKQETDGSKPAPPLGSGEPVL